MMVIIYIVCAVQVQKEALFEQDSYDARLLQKLIIERKIIVCPVDNRRVRTVMTHFRLDEGEAAAYILFNAQKHKALLTDDGELIKLCKLEQIPFICAMAVIIRLYKKRCLSQTMALKKLEELHSIGGYSERLYTHFKSEVK